MKTKNLALAVVALLSTKEALAAHLKAKSGVRSLLRDDEKTNNLIDSDSSSDEAEA
jgi:hypothetical protein